MPLAEERLGSRGQAEQALANVQRQWTRVEVEAGGPAREPLVNDVDDDHVIPGDQSAAGAPASRLLRHAGDCQVPGDIVNGGWIRSEADSKGR